MLISYLPMPEFYFDEKTVIALHDALVDKTGGSEGVRDMGLLSSAIRAPFQSFGGYEVYPDIEQKAARLAYGLVQNHAFIDGNKRIAAHVMLVYLKVNGITLTYTQKELQDILLGLAASEITFNDLVEWIKNHKAPQKNSSGEKFIFHSESHQSMACPVMTSEQKSDQDSIETE